MCEDSHELTHVPCHNLWIVVELSAPPLVVQTDQSQKDPGMDYRLGGWQFLISVSEVWSLGGRQVLLLCLLPGHPPCTNLVIARLSYTTE
jgi:hypothetical protein